jgi:hypothetical protein
LANDRRRSQQGSGAQGDVTVIHDADLEYNPDDLRRLLVPFLHEGVDAVFGSLSVGAFYISVTRWATSCSLGSATSTHVMSLSLLAKPAQACPGGGGAARATQRENGHSVHYGLYRLYAHLREHMIRLGQQQCLAGA